MATPHISANKEDIAKIVVMPGDPLRAKLFAETYMEDAKLVNEVRGMLAYTGTINGKKVTVMGHGMGLDSIGIYSYELYKFYDVETIIRFGSAGTYTKDIDIFDLIIAEKAWTKSNFGLAYGFDSNTLEASSELVEMAEEVAKELITDRKVIKTTANSSMWFYSDVEMESPAEMVEMGVDVVEMEAYALYAIAKSLGKKALTILTVSDSLVEEKSLDAEERQTKFADMFKVVQRMAEKLA